LFFHQTNVVGGEANFKNLSEGDMVEFDKKSNAKGPKAVNVKKVGAEAAEEVETEEEADEEE